MPSSRKSMVGANKKKPTNVDEYIAQSPAYAQPMLKHLRRLFHKACPKIEEELKWGAPHFCYKGIVGSFAAFKNHIGFGFWKSKLMDDPAGLFARGPKASMCTAQISSMDEMPSDKVLLSYIKQAVALNEAGTKVSRTAKQRPELKMPAFFQQGLKAHPQAKAAFDQMSPSHRREYIEWMIEAKQEATRQRRLQTALEWLAAGKPRNWKYMATKSK